MYIVAVKLQFNQVQWFYIYSYYECCFLRLKSRWIFVKKNINRKKKTKKVMCPKICQKIYIFLRRRPLNNNDDFYPSLPIRIVFFSVLPALLSGFTQTPSFLFSLPHVSRSRSAVKRIGSDKSARDFPAGGRMKYRENKSEKHIPKHL